MKPLNCKDFVFIVTSGQKEEAGLLTKAKLAHHRYKCPHCVTFEANDDKLTQLIRQGYKAFLQSSRSSS